MIVILGGTGRVWAVPVGSLIFGILFAGTRFFGFPPFSWLASDDRAYLRLMLIGLVHPRARLSAAGDPRPKGRWCSSEPCC